MKWRVLFCFFGLGMVVGLEHVQIETYKDPETTLSICSEGQVACFLYAQDSVKHIGKLQDHGETI